MSWTVSYQYGSICEGESFDDEDEANQFYEMISQRVYDYRQEFGDLGEYAPSAEIYKD